MIRCVIFDLDGTLYDYGSAHKAAFSVLSDYAEKELGIPGDEFAGLHKETMESLRATMGNVAAIHNRLIRYQNILESRGKPLHPHLLNMYRLYWETLLNVSEPYPYAAETLMELKNSGVKTGIGTDMTALMQFVKLEKFDMLKYIDFVVTSEEAGAEKPDPAFFGLCIKKAGCAASECLFVGDSIRKDVEGAANAGMNALYAGTHAADKGIDDAVIISLKDIPGWLERH